MTPAAEILLADDEFLAAIVERVAKRLNSTVFTPEPKQSSNATIGDERDNG